MRITPALLECAAEPLIHLVFCLIYGLGGRHCHRVCCSTLTYVACARASLLSSSAASPPPRPNVLLSDSRCCSHCATRSRGTLMWENWQSFFFYLCIFFIKLDTMRPRVGLFLKNCYCGWGVLTMQGGDGASPNGRGERSQWQLLACAAVRLTSGAANQINKRLISLKGNSSDFNRILITADRCLLVTL